MSTPRKKNSFPGEPLAKKRVSIKDIAQMVGVSTASVSYVLNGNNKEGKIGRKVAEKIRAVAARLNYQPNFFARSLQSGSTKTIGLIMEDISNPFFSNLASIIEKEAQENGYTVVLGCHYERTEKCNRLIDALLLRQVDGIIICPVDGALDQVRKLKRAGVPYVLVDRYFRTVPSHAVVINNYDISYRAVEHLIGQGYRNVGMIAFDSTFEHMKDRLNGYRRALRDHGLRCRASALLKVSFADMQSGEDTAIRNYLSQSHRPDAIFFANNVIAMRTLRIIGEQSLIVPEQLGLVCFDQRDAFDYYPAPITYIRQNLKEIGERSLNLLMELMQGRQLPEENLIIEAELVIRQSSMGAGRLTN